MYMTSERDKTNRFRMPLVQFATVVSNLQTNFNIGFYFIISEDENAYVWSFFLVDRGIQPSGLITAQILATKKSGTDTQAFYNFLWRRSR
jgi:hypothetical protein